MRRNSELMDWDDFSYQWRLVGLKEAVQDWLFSFYRSLIAPLMVWWCKLYGHRWTSKMTVRWCNICDEYEYTRQQLKFHVRKVDDVFLPDPETPGTDRDSGSSEGDIDRTDHSSQ